MDGASLGSWKVGSQWDSVCQSVHQAWARQPEMPVLQVRYGVFRAELGAAAGTEGLAEALSPTLSGLSPWRP